jgi:phosphoglycolate phosphatase-like HAD superfamily hydrolase
MPAYVNPVFHSVLPQHAESYANVVKSIPKVHVRLPLEQSEGKHLDDLKGSRLLPGTLDQVDPNVAKTAVTKRLAQDPKSPAKERARAMRSFMSTSIQRTKAKIVKGADSIANPKADPTAIHTIETQDWDDNLRSEQKGINYRLMHNGVAIAAEKYGSTYPALRQINAALNAQRESPQKVEGMPWICDTAEGFEKFAMNQDAIKPQNFRPAIVHNLLDNIHLLDTSIKVDPQTKGHLFQLIYSNFNNQYERMIDPTDWSQVAKKPSENEKADLPFPRPELELMEGAKKYLEEKKPGVLRILISNRMHPQVRKELERSGMQQFFDYVTGTPLETVFSPANIKDAEKTVSSPLDKVLQETFARKEADIAQVMAEKAAEEDAAAIGKTPAERTAIAKERAQKMEKMKSAREAEDKTTMLHWKQYQHTTVEQLYRKPDQTLLLDAIQSFVDAGLKFSKQVKFVTVGDTGKDVTQAYDLLASGGRVSSGIYISEAKGIVVNPGRDNQVDAARNLARQRGLNIQIDHVPSFNDVKI